MTAPTQQRPPVTITWTPTRLMLFKTAYNRALRDKKEIFHFAGHDFLISYAKYLIEYLDERLGAIE